MWTDVETIKNISDEHLSRSSLHSFYQTERNIDLSSTVRPIAVLSKVANGPTGSGNFEGMT